MSAAIWWIRRDLRLADNQALTEALRRARVIVPTFVPDPQPGAYDRAPFLARDVPGDWRVGEEYSMRHLLDRDPAGNNRNWQWVAGVTAATAPYQRVLSPLAQARKHDREGHYVRRRLPELAGVRTAAVHEPWQLSGEEQCRYGWRLGAGYPRPILRHGAARERAVAEYRRAWRPGRREEDA